MRFLILIALIVTACSPKDFDPAWTKEIAPDTFTAKFETTKGEFEIEIDREDSPAAADRFYQLVKHGYFDDAVFYRVVPNFVAQFGNSDTIVANKWREFKIPDEPVRRSNLTGTISFARSGPKTRDLDLFINLSDNEKLDSLDFEGVRGFPAFGRVSKGMSVVRQLYSGYGEASMEASDGFYTNRSEFLSRFPNLDKIKKATIK
jgi:peptidyl-prolyl cis-trans isomerase A (cyclophilin A)